MVTKSGLIKTDTLAFDAYVTRIPVDSQYSKPEQQRYQWLKGQTAIDQLFHQGGRQYLVALHGLFQAYLRRRAAEAVSEPVL